MKKYQVTSLWHEVSIYVAVLGLASAFIAWHKTPLEWWQALSLAIGVMMVSIYIDGMSLNAKRAIFIFVIVAAVVLLVGTELLIFWVVYGPEIVIPVHIEHKWIETRGDSETEYIDRYFVRVVDSHGHRYKVELRDPHWEALSKGQKTSITYHKETVAGRWLSRSVVTQFGDKSVLWGGGRFGTPMEAINTGMDMFVSAGPFILLMWSWIKQKRQLRKKAPQEANDYSDLW